MLRSSSSFSSRATRASSVATGGAYGLARRLRRPAESGAQPRTATGSRALTPPKRSAYRPHSTASRLTYPTDLDGEVHDDGSIWSPALWEMRAAIGHVQADTAILWAQFNWTGTTMPALAQRIVNQAQSRFGQGPGAQAAFHARGILP
jgi:hypothetical protein